MGPSKKKHEHHYSTPQGSSTQGLTPKVSTSKTSTGKASTSKTPTGKALASTIALTAQGLTAQGLTAQGLTAQGLTAQGLTAQGSTAKTSTANAAIPKAATAHDPTGDDPSVHGSTAGSPKPAASTSNASTSEGIPSPTVKRIKAKLEKDTPKPGSNMAKIMDHSIKRDVFFRSKGEQAKRDQSMLNGGRLDYRCAAQITARGDRTEPCENCKIGRGKFTVCATIPGLFNGACGNCVYGGEHGSCANVNSGAIPEKGLKRFGLTREDVDKLLAAAESKASEAPTSVQNTPKPRTPKQAGAKRGPESDEDGVRASKKHKTLAAAKKN